MENKISWIKALKYLEITYEILLFFSVGRWIESVVLEIVLVEKWNVTFYFEFE